MRLVLPLFLPHMRLVLPLFLPRSRYERYALVTDLDLDPSSVSALYREYGDCENIFDELKNQWGWASFTTKRKKQYRLQQARPGGYSFSLVMRSRKSIL